MKELLRFSFLIQLLFFGINNFTFCEKLYENDKIKVNDTSTIIRTAFEYVYKYDKAEFFGSCDENKSFFKDSIFNGKYFPEKYNEYQVILIDTDWLNENCKRDSVGCLYTELTRFQKRNDYILLSFYRWFETRITEVNHIYRRPSEWLNMKIVKKERGWAVKTVGKTIIE